MRQDVDPLAVGLLADFGVHPTAADLMVVLAKHGELTSRELEHRLRLPQPRVNTLLRDLSERGWVGYRVEKRLASGRPRHVYRLQKELPTILEDLRRAEEEAHARRLELLERVLARERRRGEARAG